MTYFAWLARDGDGGMRWGPSWLCVAVGAGEYSWELEVYAEGKGGVGVTVVSYALYRTILNEHNENPTSTHSIRRGCHGIHRNSGGWRTSPDDSGGRD